MLKSITLNGPAIDNLGNFHDAGTDLTVGDEAAAGVIDEPRARDLASGPRAVGHHERPAPTKGEGRKPSRKRKAAPRGDNPAAASPEPTLKPDAVEAAADVSAEPVADAAD